MQNAVKEALALTESIPKDETDQSSEKLELISQQIEHGSTLLNSLFGIEEFAQKQLESSITVLKKEHAELQQQAISTYYNKFSIDPLRWRDINGWPRLIVFDIDSPTFTLPYGGYCSRGFVRRIMWDGPEPDIIENCYDDVVKKLCEISSRRENYYKRFSVVCRYEGVIPGDAREKIVKARSLGVFK